MLGKAGAALYFPYIFSGAGAGGVMISRTYEDRAKALMLAAGLTLAFAAPALAQSSLLQSPSQQSTLQQSPWPQEISEAPAAEDQAANADDQAPSVNDEDVLKDIDVDKLDWSQLDTDVSPPASGPAAKTRSGKPVADSRMNWSNETQANGASAVSVKQSVSPFWDTRVGADMTVTRGEPTTMSELLAEKTDNGGSLPQSGGSAWAAITAPGAGPIWDKTAVEARIDPGQDQSRLGTSISKQMPLGNQTSLTLSNGYSVTQQGGVVLVPGFASRPERSYETEQSARVELGGTGTSVSAGQTLSTSDDKWLRQVGAEQKLPGGISISGSIGETAEGTTSTSISAGYKTNW